MSESGSSSSGGIGVTGLLGVAFVVLKLTRVINWPWLWVLAPFWITLVLVLAILGIALGYVAIRDARLNARIRQRNVR